jgi:hypothetical protein
VAAVTEHVQQRACENEEEWQHAEQVSSVLRGQEEADHEQKAQGHQKRAGVGGHDCQFLITDSE